MKKTTDSNGNIVRGNDRGDRADIVCQMVMNISTDENRTASSIRFGYEECYITAEGVIDYAAASGMPRKSMTAPLEYIIDNLTEEEVAEYTRITRKLQDIIVEYTVTPQETEEVV